MIKIIVKISRLCDHACIKISSLLVRIATFASQTFDWKLSISIFFVCQKNSSGLITFNQSRTDSWHIRCIYISIDESSVCSRKKIQVASSSLERGDIRSFIFGLQSGVSAENVVVPCRTRSLPSWWPPGRWFQLISLTDILSTSDSGQILTWFIIILTAIRARPPSIPCDASYLSGATLPPC